MKHQNRILVLFLLLFVSAQVYAQPDADGPIKFNNKDQQILDDLIVDGSACIGFDCVNGENFGFKTLRLKENNLRIHFWDTSTAASFPSTDWCIEANDSTNGGANHFSVVEEDAGKTPFRITGGAPTNSLWVDAQGDVGIGVASAAVELHVRDGDTPTLRLEQDGSSGFTPQTWDLAGNETNFFIRDVTNGSRLPFRIRPSAPTSSIDVANDGDVGLGTTGPDARLHIDMNAGGSQPALLINNDGASDNDLFVITEGEKVGLGTTTPTLSAGASGAFFEVENSSNPGFILDNTGASGREYLFYSSNAGGFGAFRIFDATGGADRMVINNIGRLEVFEDSPTKPNGGPWIGASDRRLKNSIKDFEGGLEEIMKINPVNFQYNGLGGIKSVNKEYVGVIAQDIQKVAPYMVGTYKEHVSGMEENVKSQKEYLSVDPNAFTYMLINATKEQQNVLTEHEDQMIALQKENDELRAMITELQAAFEQLTISDIELDGTGDAYLKQNIPNPFDTDTQISYSIPENAGAASIMIMNLKGQMIKEVQITNFGKGVLKIKADDLPSGSYTYSLQIDGSVVSTQKMVLQR